MNSAKKHVSLEEDSDEIPAPDDTIIVAFETLIRLLIMCPELLNHGNRMYQGSPEKQNQ